MEFGALVAGIAVLSLTVTKIVDLIRNLVDKNDTLPKWVWSVLALVVGLAFALGWQLNVVDGITALVPALVDTTVNKTAAEILTGLLIGGGAGFFHELLDALSGVATTLQGPPDAPME